MATSVLAAFETVFDGPRAAALLQHPLRPRILALARDPASASDIARSLGESRQKINYHVRRLERARFLDRVGPRMRRNMVEQQFVATARAYVIAPDMLGPLAAHAGTVTDAMSAAALMAVTSRAQSDLARASHAAARDGKRLATLSLTADIRFESPTQREAFTTAIREAVAGVIARCSSPFSRPDESHAPPGRPYRLVLGCYPIPRAEDLSIIHEDAPHD